MTEQQPLTPAAHAAARRDMRSHLRVDSDWICPRDPSHSVGVRAVLGWPQCRECGAAPDYPVRPAYLPYDFRLNVYVPSKDEASLILLRRLIPGSAIVGIPDDPAVYFEGWAYDAVQYADLDERGRWEAGVMTAADRLVTAYPTASHMGVPDTAVTCVGAYDPRERTLVITDEERLADWLSWNPAVQVATDAPAGAGPVA